MDIIIGEARRRWSEDEKRAIIAETFRDGETVAKVARWRHLNPSMLFAWRKRYREVSSLTAPQEPADFVPAIIAPPDGQRQRLGELVLRHNDPVIELDFESGARLRVFDAADPGLVKAAIEAMTQR